MSDIKQRKKSSDEEKRRRRRRDEDDHEERRRRDDDDDHEEKRRRRDEDDHEERRRDDDDDDDHEEKRRRRDEDDDDESRRDAMKSRSDHVKLMLTFMCLSVSLIMMWIVHQQNWRFAEMKEQYADLYEKTQSVLELQSQMSSVSHQLQVSVDEYDRIQSSITLMTKLRRDVTSIHDTCRSLQEHQETSSLQFQTINARFRNIAETWQGRLATAADDLAALKTDSRSAHGSVTEGVNDADGRLRILSERLQELEDGIKRNTRVLDRTEEEDARRVQELLDWNSGRLSKLQERLRLVVGLRDELRTRLEKSVPRVQRWESQLPAVKESVRSMLKVRARLSETQRRLKELTLQVNTTEQKMSETLSEISSQDMDTSWSSEKHDT